MGQTHAYNLKAIKIEPAGGQLGIESSSSRPGTGSIDTVNSEENTLPIISIADLYALVKQYREELGMPERKPAALTQLCRDTGNGVRHSLLRRFGCTGQLFWR